ncbi:uncharacterized protein LOC105703547 isoform X1 [Orussus abietinus]|uniref:uncharacterized protein LOC105703547 isoform X1 n=1 Tax=Orussus abietinus TaxID=222816 RepID=UPI00062669FA|nr:uncharacterized protein LOC105703547 isoform X1 [Orussus abietinus]XP_023288618.1 uncharacterized protein LOC105703547 isoform X1 [Orussus abietinus]XP_023288619.1 uncharacterized protein LOC105703547 isoform X1 [Orussus abietinus]XP_023288620.1 uncharacterized protein LOC105703547 isoform X1 [Orussus abietinus]XP_023288621.1 uncharacterized protein LOC105703547 isoform X1 [Orussus abietinus]XP_023288622.1 uncharacterized protein LOC105703547 isoform X1 [Orussus abietinus]
MADPTAERFSLKWNNFSNNLTAGFLSHLTENDLVDVTLAVEGKLLQAHKLVLSVCSPYFKTIFKNIPCQHPVIVLKDMGYADVESLLKFMYQGEVNVKQEDLASFLKVAEVLQIKGLTGDETKCEEEPSEGAVRSSKQKFDIQAEPLNSSPVGDTNVTQSAINNNQLPEASIKVKRSQELDGQVAQSSKKCKMSASSTKELDAPVLSPQAVIAKEEPLEYDDDEDDRTFFVDDQLGHLSESEKTLDEGSTMLVQNDVKEKNRLMFNNLSDAPSVDVDSAVPAGSERTPYMHQLSEARLSAVESNIMHIKNDIQRIYGVLLKYQQKQLLQPVDNKVAVEAVVQLDGTFPLKTAQQLAELEEQLKSSAEKKDQLMKYFDTIGGTGLDDTVKRTLVKTFSNHLAMNYSWEGRKGKLKLNELEFLNVLFRSLLRRCHDADKKKFDVRVREWFRQAKARYDNGCKRIEQRIKKSPVEYQFETVNCDADAWNLTSNM